MQHDDIEPVDGIADIEEPERSRDDDEAPEIALDADAPDGVSGDLSGRSYDELSDLARAAIERDDATAKPEHEPDDVAAAVVEGSEPPGPDADERPV